MQSTLYIVKKLNYISLYAHTHKHSGSYKLEFPLSVHKARNSRWVGSCGMVPAGSAKLSWRGGKVCCAPASLNPVCKSANQINITAVENWFRTYRVQKTHRPTLKLPKC
jgi:hypothetical protein